MSKYLFYINFIHYGGAERVMVNLANSLANRGNEVIFVTSSYAEREYVLVENIKRLVLETTNRATSFFGRNLVRTSKLRSICKKEEPDLLISFMAEPNFRALTATLFTNTKNLISIRNSPDWEYPNPIYRLLATLLYPYAKGYVFQTREALEWFPRKIQSKARIIPNYIDNKFYKETYVGDRRNIVAVGRLEKQKNYRLLITAFSYIASEFLSDRLLIYGEGSEEANLKEYVEKLGLKSRVIFMGTCPNLQDEIRASKLYVLSSDYEGLPNSLMEAMALGIPVISTDCPCGGPRSLIENNRSGLLVECGDEASLAASMKRLLLEPNYAAKLGEEGKGLMESYREEIVFDIWEGYLQEIIASRN